MGNFDIVRDGLSAEINALAAEVRELNAQVDETKGNIKSKQAQMGIKLLALREMAYEEYGEQKHGLRDADGRYAPNNWGRVCESAGITTKHAGKCMRFARDPEGMSARHRENNRRSTQNDPCRKVLKYLNQLLPHMTFEEKHRCMETIYSSIQKMREAA